MDTSSSKAPVLTCCFSFAIADAEQLRKLCGPLNEHLKQVERRLNIRILNRGGKFALSGTSEKALHQGEQVLHKLYAEALASNVIDASTVHLLLQEILFHRETSQFFMSRETIHNTGSAVESEKSMAEKNESSYQGLTAVKTPKGLIRARGKNQCRYVETILSNDINFGIGPAGTGKTFLAVACAIQALEENRVQRILLVRPAVEAGEKLGFLPGDLAQKIDPYLRPLYDALYEMLGFERVGKLIEKNIIEIASLAYMRGRTLNHAFIILDESQNTTVEQMKMFLTRIGFGSTAVITGDITQVDLPRGVRSGLNHAIDVLQGVDGIGYLQFTSKDVVRHPLVQRIVEAYQAHENSLAVENLSRSSSKKECE